MGMKFVVLVIFMIFFWILELGDWVFKWIEGNERLQIVFVMMLFLFIMNVMQYYIIDSYIKKQEGKGEVEGKGYDEVDQEEGVDGLVVSEDSEDSESEEEEGQRMLRVGKGVRDLERDEYDFDVDGDSQMVVGSSLSWILSWGVLIEDLFFKE